MGNHIEMTKNAGIDYSTGTTFQPEEHKFPLQVKDLNQLNKALKKLGVVPTYQTHKDFIIFPVKG